MRFLFWEALRYCYNAVRRTHERYIVTLSVARRVASRNVASLNHDVTPVVTPAGVRQRHYAYGLRRYVGVTL
jgi:hypothetical protein